MQRKKEKKMIERDGKDLKVERIEGTTDWEIVEEIKENE